LGKIGNSKKTIKYEVIVYYKEPLFCKTIGKDPETVFAGSFTIEAYNEETAKEKARREFNIIAQHSNVNWNRQIVKFKVKKIGIQ